MDASSSSVLQQRQTVHSVLADLGLPPTAHAQRMLQVWNKADAVLPLAANVAHLFRTDLQQRWEQLERNRFSATAPADSKRNSNHDVRSHQYGPRQAHQDVGAGAGVPSEEQLQLAVRMWTAVLWARQHGSKRAAAAAAVAVAAAQTAVSTPGSHTDHADIDSRSSTHSDVAFAEREFSHEVPAEPAGDCAGLLDLSAGPEASGSAGLVIAATKQWNLTSLRGAIESKLMQLSLDTTAHGG